MGNCIDLAKARHLAPERSGQNWHEFIEARQLRMAEYKTYRMQDFVVSPKGDFMHG